MGSHLANFAQSGPPNYEVDESASPIIPRPSLLRKRLALSGESFRMASRIRLSPPGVTKDESDSPYPGNGDESRKDRPIPASRIPVSRATTEGTHPYT
jgi:hypothetical protein